MTEKEATSPKIKRLPSTELLQRAREAYKPLLDEPLTFAEQLQVQEANYQRLLDWVGRYDDKVTTLLTLATALLAGIGTVIPDSKSLPPFIWTLVVLASAPLLLVFYHVFVGTSPHLDSPRRVNDHQPELSHLFFGTSAQMDSSRFAHELLTRTRAAYLADLAAQVCSPSSLSFSSFSLRSSFSALLMLYSSEAPDSSTTCNHIGSQLSRS